MTGLVCISDTHGKHTSVKIPECDILLFAGDFSMMGRPGEVKSFLDWFSIQPAKHLVYVAGNHDFSYQDSPEFKSRMIELYPNLHYLEESSIELCGLKIYGDPHQPWFCDWAFNLPRGKALQEQWAKIPDDTDVLLTHGPVFGVMDTVSFTGERVGDRDLLNRVAQLKQIKMCVGGHIHENNGIVKVGDVTFVNASICDDNYEPVNKPVVIDL